MNAGETEAVHEDNPASQLRGRASWTSRANRHPRLCAPTCIGPYTKDTYLNPLLVNTYALGYYYNMYVGGVPLLRHGGAMIVVNPMPYKWTSPTHDAYKAIFEEAVAPLGPERFEEQQERFANDERLNDIYRRAAPRRCTDSTCTPGRRTAWRRSGRCSWLAPRTSADRTFSDGSESRA